MFHSLSSEAHYGPVNHLVSQFLKDLEEEEIIIQIFERTAPAVPVSLASLGGLLPALKPGTGLTEGGLFRHISK